MRILLITPPMTQLNTPYPATAFLKGTLQKQGYSHVDQVDASLDLALKIFSKTGILDLKSALEKKRVKSAHAKFFLENSDLYADTIEAIVSFLQGKDPSLATRIVSRQFLPEGPLFHQIQDEEFLQWAFGALGTQDQAKYFASLYLDEIAKLIKDEINSSFALTKYGEKLAASQASFKSLEKALSVKPSFIERYIDALTKDYLTKYTPDLVGITAPFPGNVFGAFQIAKKIKSINPKVKTVLGGGYVNTELRSLEEKKVFQYFDYLTFDDGEKPFLSLLEHLSSKQKNAEKLVRVMHLSSDKKTILKHESKSDLAVAEWGTPTYQGLRLQEYLSILELPNPMHRLWSDSRWNKLMLAHGCYWKKCSFCDVNLDYIGRYQAAEAEVVLSQMDSLFQETGQRGFHFVDEAAPPALLKALSKKIIEKRKIYTWWGNIRFEKAYNAELTGLMAKAGCVAVSGGLEVASDRLLKKMNKGVTVAQVAEVTRGFRDAGILVHAYLMYGFPTETLQDTIDSLERVRLLFEQGLIQSAYWHRFSATVHSPVGKNPNAFGIKLKKKKTDFLFAENDLEFEELEFACDHDRLGQGLQKAVYNFMHGVGLDEPVHTWFDFPVPSPTLSSLQ